MCFLNGAPIGFPPSPHSPFQCHRIRFSHRRGELAALPVPQVTLLIVFLNACWMAIDMDPHLGEILCLYSGKGAFPHFTIDMPEIPNLEKIIEDLRVG